MTCSLAGDRPAPLAAEWRRVNLGWLGLLFWLLLVVVALAPLAQRRLLHLRRDGTVQRLGRARGSRVLTLVEHRETYRLLGIPILRHDEIDDAERVLRAISLAPETQPIDLIVHTSGAGSLAAEQIAHALVRHPATVTVFVPHYALGGGTVIALAADQIVLDPNAALGPVVATVGPYPAPALVALAQKKPAEALGDRTLALIDQACKAHEQARSLVAELLMAGGATGERAAEVAETLTGGTWTPRYPILVEEAERLGLPVSTVMPRDVYALMDLYEIGPRARPSTTAVPLEGPR